MGATEIMSHRVYRTKSVASNRSGRAQRGQMLIVAIAILFVLLIIGGVFVASIGRNLVAAGRSRDDQGAQAFAEAGIKYCNDNLNTSPEGADWRPVPSTPAGPNPVTDPDYRWLSNGFTRLFYQGGRALVRVVYDPHADDPGSQFLRIESVGRAGDLNQALDPTVFVANGNAPRQRRELIGIKQIGLTDYLRWFTNHDRRNVANFLGIPAMENSVVGGSGYNDVSMVIGDPTLALYPGGINTTTGNVLFGGPVRSNATLQLGGELHIYESTRGNLPIISPEGVMTNADIVLAPNQDIDHSGSITSTDYQVFVNQPLTAVANYNLTNPNFVLPSANASFTSFSGAIRDGSSLPDANGATRAISTLDAPVMDGYESGSGTLRYRDLTRNSGAWNSTSNGLVNSGFYGWGTGVYVDNTSDLQPETQNASGVYSLRADWLNPQASFGLSYWSGPYYRPPGVLIELMGDHIHMTRNDGKAFRKPDGTPVSTGGNVVDIPLNNTARSATTQYVFPDGTSYNLPPLANDGDQPSANPLLRDPVPTNFPGDKLSYGVNLVIMSEGNVRVKGMYGVVTDATNPSGDHLSRVHLTIVSGGTAYIEGNILKGDGYFDGTQINYEKASTCSILAKDYVTVNTTMFMAANNQGPNWTSVIGTDLHYIDLPANAATYDPTVAFGVNPASYTTGGGAAQSQLYLFVRHASMTDNAGGGSTAFNFAVNPAQPTWAQYHFDGFNVQTPPMPVGFPPETYALGQRYVGGAFVPDSTQVAPAFEQRVFPLCGSVTTPGSFSGNFASTQIDPNLNLFGVDNVFHFTKDTTAAAIVATLGLTGFSETEDYLFSAAMVAPLDIRIEAMLYAQERSFFVIPGYSFNQNPNDTRTNFNLTKTRPIYNTAVEGNAPAAKTPFPFYNEPMDVKITIYGAVSENYSASAGDQAAWISKWGYIPTTYGSSGLSIPDQHMVPQATNEAKDGIVRGMEFVYDPALPMPYANPSKIDLLGSTLAAQQLRQLRAVRSKYYSATASSPAVFQTLPSVPRLPVCPGMLYFGPTDSPVVP